jgi:hypothetical protein
MLAAGLSHHLFPAVTSSPLCVLWSVCAATGRVLGQRLATRGGRAPVSDIGQASSVPCVLDLGASPDGLLRRRVGGCLSGTQARCYSSPPASDATADGWSPAAVLAAAGHTRCQTLLCTAVYRFQRTSDDRGVWTLTGLVFPACPVRSVLLQVETLGPWGGPGQRTSCGLPALAVPGRQGNMWTLAGDSWAGPWDSGPLCRQIRAARWPVSAYFVHISGYPCLIGFPSVSLCSERY